MIYFARYGADGPVKIGYTATGLASRLNFLQSGCPWEIVVLGVTDGGSAEEAELHQRFRGARMRGEWFHPTTGLLEFIARVAVPAPELLPRRRHAVSEDTDVRAIRAALGLSQVEMAKALGVHQASISVWEKNGVPNRGPIRSALRQLVDASRSEAE